jgi:hypothetical protein
MRESGTFLDSSACAILVIHLVCLLLFRHIVGLGAVEDGLVGDGPLAITYAPSLRTAMSRVSTHHALCPATLGPLESDWTPSRTHTERSGQQCPGGIARGSRSVHGEGCSR